MEADNAPRIAGESLAYRNYLWDDFFVVEKPTTDRPHGSTRTSKQQTVSEVGLFQIEVDTDARHGRRCPSPHMSVHVLTLDFSSHYIQGNTVL